MGSQLQTRTTGALRMARFALAVLVLSTSTVDAADCRQFFRQSYSYQYVAPIVAYPQVYYQAGRDIEAEALAEKVARLVTQKLEIRQQQKQVATRPQSALAQHCAKCHSGATPKAGLVYDGATGMDARLVTAALKQIKDGSMPKDHPIPPEVKAALMDELLSLEAEPVPPVVPRDVGNDLPRPPPDDGGLR
jgi:cytochrome c553